MTIIKINATATMAMTFLLVAVAQTSGQEREMTMETHNLKNSSAFYPVPLRERVRKNVERDPWARAAAAEIVAAAKPWLEMSDAQLWSLMFGPAIDRSWHVWSDGHCPACRQGVPMYQWKTDPLAHPWKMICPHCAECFPKNDFAAYHRSGLNEQGVFDPARADRKLLVNAEHPDPEDPRHMFGVDDGFGYVERKNRWRFIGAYLVYGQWKKMVCGSASPAGIGGIAALAAAHVVSGDPVAARKAAILLDRVADLYPEFDFKTQAWCYETRNGHGYVSTWHDACEETCALALAYDQIFEAIRGDAELVAFLRRKAAVHGLANPKASFGDIQRNIEERILGDAVRNPNKIHSNYPRQAIALTVIETVLGWPGNRERVMERIGEIVAKSTAVDGVTGEKGLPNYASFVIESLASFLGLFDRMDPTFLPELMQRHPSLRQTWRFFIDTWCLQIYYPSAGDALWFAGRATEMRGVKFASNYGYSGRDTASIEPSMFTFLWRLHELTGDPAYAQALLSGNAGKTENLPRDLFAANPAGTRAALDKVLAEHGPTIRLGSVNKEQWHLAILRSGKGEHARALWLDYDAGGQHAHFDGMNLGLFARGLDLLPDFGYPPVQFGGWGAPRATWYSMTAAHNTVVVDGRDHSGGRFSGTPVAGRTTLWADGKVLRAMRADGAGMYPPDPKTGFEGCRRYERTAVLVDLPVAEGEKYFYVVDIFRVAGGRDHAKFITSHFGSVSAPGGFGPNAQMRSFPQPPHPAMGWCATWRIEDRYGYLPKGTGVQFRYTDLTTDAHASLGEAWVVAGGYDRTDEAWVPRAMIRRTDQRGALETTFVAVMEPCGGMSAIAAIRRLPLHRADGTEAPDSAVAVEVTNIDGGQDLIVAADPAIPGVLIQKDWNVTLTGELGLVRKDRDGKAVHAALANGERLRIGDRELAVHGRNACREWSSEELNR
jgi:hypothetical protein